MPTLIHFIAQRVFRSRGARADRDVGVFGYAWIKRGALVEWLWIEFGGRGVEGMVSVMGRGGGRGGGLGMVGWDGEKGATGMGFGGEGRVVLEGPWGWRSGGREKEMGDALLLASLLAVEPVFWTFSEIWLPKSLWDVLEVGFGGKWEGRGREGKKGGGGVSEE